MSAMGDDIWCIVESMALQQNRTKTGNWKVPCYNLNFWTGAQQCKLEFRSPSDPSQALGLFEAKSIIPDGKLMVSGKSVSTETDRQPQHLSNSKSQHEQTALEMV